MPFATSSVKLYNSIIMASQEVFAETYESMTLDDCLMVNGDIPAAGQEGSAIVELNPIFSISSFIEQRGARSRRNFAVDPYIGDSQTQLLLARDESSFRLEGDGSDWFRYEKDAGHIGDLGVNLSLLSFEGTKLYLVSKPSTLLVYS